MQIRNVPPGRRSTSWLVVVNPRGAPCQCLRCSGPVQASKSEREETSKIRVISNSVSFFTMFFVAMIAPNQRKNPNDCLLHRGFVNQDNVSVSEGLGFCKRQGQPFSEAI